MALSSISTISWGNSAAAAPPLYQRRRYAAALSRFSRSRRCFSGFEVGRLDRRGFTADVTLSCPCPRAFLEDTPGPERDTSGRLASNGGVESDGKMGVRDEPKTTTTSYTGWRPSKMWISESGRRRKGAKKKNYSERMTAILASLKERPESEIEQGLEQWKGTLQAREQSVILNEERSWSRALRIFSWLQRQAQEDADGHHSSLNVVHYNIMLKILGRAEKLDLVEKLWAEMEERKIAPTNVSYSTVMDAYGKAGRPERALEWFEEQNSRRGGGFEPDEVTMNTIVGLHKRCGNVAAAEKAFQSFPRNVEACNMMIDLYGRANQFEDASRTFEEMMELGIDPDTVTFNTMIKVCGLAGRLEEAEAMYSRMSTRGVAADVATFNVLLDLSAKGGKVRKSLEFFSRMKEAEVMPDEITFHTLLHALVVEDMVDDAEVLVREMEALGMRAGETVNVGLARMYIRLGLLDKARRVLLESCCGSLSPSSLGAVIDSYGEEGLWREAEKLFLEQGENSARSVESFNTMIKAYGLAGVHEKAWSLFSSMEEKGVPPDEVTFNTIIHTLVSSAQMGCEAAEKRVEQVRGRMREKGFVLRQSSFNALIGMYGRLGNVTEAQRTLNQMQAAAGVAPDDHSYGALVNAYVEAGSVKGAEGAAASMRQAGFTPNKYVYTSLMKLYANVEDLEEVEKMYSDMEGGGREDTEGPDLFATNFLLDQYARAERFKDAERIFNNLSPAKDISGLETAATANEVTYTIMLEMYRKSGKVHQAMEVAKRMLDMEDLKDVMAYNSILRLYSSMGRVTQAMEVFELLTKRGVEPDMVTYSVMAGVLKKVGSVQEALALFAAAGTGGLSPTTGSLTTLLSLYVRAGLSTECLQTCEKLRHGRYALDNAAFNALIYAYGILGRLDESLRLYMEMQSRGLQPDVITYTTLITVYGKAGLLEGVSRMFKRMKRAGCEPSMATYRAVMDIYRNAGKLELAAMVQQEMQFAQYIREEGLRYDATDLGESS